nr:MAG TPA: hypothetical protein [Caudoviricetes sp.]
MSFFTSFCSLSVFWLLVCRFLEYSNGLHLHMVYGGSADDGQDVVEPSPLLRYNREK